MESTSNRVPSHHASHCSSYVTIQKVAPHHVQEGLETPASGFRNTNSQVNVSSYSASYSGQQAYAWTVTFMSISGDVGELVVNGTEITSGDVAVTERVKVRDSSRFCTNQALFAHPGNYRCLTQTYVFGSVCMLRARQNVASV